MYPPGRVLWVVSRYDHHRQSFHILRNLDTVLTFQIIIQFLIEVLGELVEDADDIESGSNVGEIPQEKTELAAEINVQTDCL